MGLILSEPTFKYVEIYIPVSACGNKLINYLNYLGNFGWELTIKRTTSRWIFKKKANECTHAGLGTVPDTYKQFNYESHV